MVNWFFRFIAKISSTKDNETFSPDGKRKPRRRFTAKQQIGSYELVRKISKGGNGEVWQCKSEENDQFAIKLLVKTNDTAFQRFKDEVQITLQSEDLSGVINIHDYYIPHCNAIESFPYYVMDIGESINNITKQLRNTDIHYTIHDEVTYSIKSRSELIIQLADVLVKLHGREITHRDIKPSNVIILNGKLKLIDFGLARFPKKKDISRLGDKIGPFHTIAPEITRTDNRINWYKSDVYSLAKTAWMILTGDSTGFEGQYNPNSVIGLKKYYPNFYFTMLDDLLVRSTDNEPDKRPSTDIFLDEFLSWFDAISDFHTYNRNQWGEFANRLFPIAIPKRVEWKDLTDIISIFNAMGETSSLNHAFLPGSGGMDIIGAKPSVESGLLEIDMGFNYVMLPFSLMFESFDSHHEWFYMRLELKEIERAIPDSTISDDGSSEDLDELTPGEYVHHGYIETAYEKGIPLPNERRTLTRFLNGSIVIFNKRSHYNLNEFGYDALHNSMTADQFRNHIFKLIHRD